MNGRPIGEDDLQAFVDGRLDAERQVEVAAYLERHADVARRVDGYRRQRDALRAALAPVAEEPVPPELNLARMIEARRRVTAGRARWRMAAAAVLLVCLGGAGGWGLHSVMPVPAAQLASAAGVAALAQEAADSYAVYASDHLRPVELRSAERAELVDWAAERLHRRVPVPDLSAAGYRFMGGRMVATPHGAAVLFMYDDDHGTRLVVLSRPMAEQDRTAAMAPYARGKVAGFSWADKGVGFSLVGPVEPDRLHPLADEIRRQVGRDI
ncbi:anti-sigma factor family protein [Ferrovibrio xuzhouensis]|uniref:Anti-sigma factor family protein n=1 Tax=Ferrovibrio xuzhouensis TaxID=1576914 RepID=A0ABV7VCZ7_9PROT